MPSAIFKEYIYALRRKVVAGVTFSLIAPEAKELATATLPASGAFSRPEQVLNNITHISAPIATFEPNHWRLDGTFALPRRPEESNMEVGFWNAVMSDDNGCFAQPPVATITFSQVQNIKRFNVIFDRESDNYCTALEITAYDSTGYEVYHESVTDNTSSHFQTQDGAYSVHRIVWKFYRTNRPRRFLRISELDFGLTIKFTGEDILDVSLTTEANPTGAAFPVPSFNARVKNNGRFDVLDSESYAGFLYPRQPFEYRQGLFLPNGSIEWADMGTYYLQTWDVSDHEVNFSCGGKTSTLEALMYYGSTLEESSVGVIIERILTALGLDAYIAPILFDSPPVPGFLGNANYRDILAVLSELSCCLAFENARNTVEYVDILPARTATDIIDYNNALEGPVIGLADDYNGVILTESQMSTEQGQLANVSFEVEAQRDITVVFDAPQSGNVNYEVSTGFALNDVKIFTMYMTAVLTGNGIAEITVTGQRVTLNSMQTFYEAPWRDPLEPEYGYPVNLPMMIFTEKYPAFRMWFLERKFEMLKRRITVDVSWRQNFFQNVGDVVSVQANKKNAFDMTAVKQSLSFSGGALGGSTALISVQPKFQWNYRLDGSWRLGERPFAWTR